MKDPTVMEDAIDAMWIVLSTIFVGAIIGLIFHHWPMPVNESVFIPTNEKEK